MSHEEHAAEPRAEAARRAGVRIQPRPARDSLFRRWRKRIVSGSGAVTGCKWGQMVFSTAVHLPTTRNQAQMAQPRVGGRDHVGGQRPTSRRGRGEAAARAGGLKPE